MFRFIIGIIQLVLSLGVAIVAIVIAMVMDGIEI